MSKPKMTNGSELDRFYAAVQKETEPLREENKKLREALRKHACFQRHRPAQGGGTIHIGYSCEVCGSEWPKRSPETHRAHCLLAAHP